MKSIVTLDEINPSDMVEVISDVVVEGAPFTREVVNVNSDNISITDGSETWGIVLDMSNYDSTVETKTGKLCHVFNK